MRVREREDCGVQYAGVREGRGDARDGHEEPRACGFLQLEIVLALCKESMRSMDNFRCRIWAVTTEVAEKIKRV
jgi:hypothetical protein